MSDNTITNTKGGKHSQIQGKISEVPPRAIIEVSRIMAEGESRYPREANLVPNWHSLECITLLDHALEHVANFISMRNSGKRNKLHTALMREELGHATARIMMADEIFLIDDYYKLDIADKT